jgi:hypothetical protein
VAVAAHHYTWWPSVVTILNDRWEREGTFVHSGWVEDVRWLAANRLVIAGFSQDRNGGMVGWLDASNINGASPEKSGSQYMCDQCGTARPLHYAVLPRSELNRVTGSPFNGATLALAPGRVLATTAEVVLDGETGSAVGALYEFASDGRLISARYNDRYWDRHRALEIAGKLDHSREQCPEREGPPLIDIWDPAHGWQRITNGR